MDETPPDLQAAREEHAAARTRLKELCGERAPRPRPGWGASWRRLRRAVEALRDSLPGWAPAREQAEPAAGPDWERRFRELEARALRCEESLSSLEARQDALDAERERALSELFRVEEGWRLLRQETRAPGAPLPEDTMAALVGKARGLAAEWERLIAEQNEACREYESIDRAWRWLLRQGMPAVVERPEAGPRALALGRLLADLDRRWRQSQQRFRRLAGEAAAGAVEERLAESLKREERLSAEVDALRLDNEDLSRRLAQARGFEADVETLKKALEKAFREGQTWRDLCEAARQDMDHLLATQEEQQKRINELTRLLERSHAEAAQNQARATGEIDRLSALLKSVGEEHQRQVEALAAELAAARLAAEAARHEAGAPSLEPFLEPGTQRLLELLRHPIESAYARLRRLASGKLPQDQRALVRLAGAALSRAAGLVRGVREFVDEERAPADWGRLQAPLEAALSAWEPAFRRQGIALIRQIPTDLPPVPLRQESLRIASYHLLRNAYEALPRGGTLSVKAWQEPSGEVCLSFQDTGAGFSKEALENLFLPFYSAKTGHLGLGLALVRRIMRRAGGDAEARNAEKGALVVLKWPAPAPSAAPLTP